MYNNIQSIKKNPETSLAGSKWSSDEDINLLEEIKDKNYEEIALIHKRTTGAIRSHLREIAVKMINDGNTYEEVSIITKLSKEEIAMAVEKKNIKNTVKNPIINTEIETEIKIAQAVAVIKIESQLDILKDIRDILIRLENKLYLS
jgi:hypothetical protein